MAADQPQRGDAAEFVIRFIDEDDGVARPLQDSFNAAERDGGPGGIVGIGDQHGASGWRDCREELVEGKLEVAFAIIDLPDSRPGQLGVEAVHGVGRPQQNCLAAIVEIGIDQDLDGFIGAVGDQQLTGLDVKELLERRPHVCVVRIDGEALSAQLLLEEVDDSGGGTDCVLVEV